MTLIKKRLKSIQSCRFCVKGGGGGDKKKSSLEEILGDLLTYYHSTAEQFDIH